MYSYFHLASTMRVPYERALLQVSAGIAQSSDAAFAQEPERLSTQQSLHELRTYAQHYQPEKVILIGIGGSHLGAQALYDIYNACTHGHRPTTLVSVTSIDSSACHTPLQEARAAINNGERVTVVIVSKSGMTFETAAQASILWDAAGPELRAHAVVITDEDSDLAQRAAAAGVRVVSISPALGGRFSVLSAAGCGVLELCGINTDALRARAARVRAQDALESAAFWVAASQAGYGIYDTFTFIPSAASLGGWMRQLIGESLGKQGKGLLPTVSVGSQDLHSVAQYYLDGPPIIATQFLMPQAYSVQQPVGNNFMSQVAQLPPDLSVGKLHESIVEGVVKAYQQADRPFVGYRLDPQELDGIAAWMQLKMFEIVLIAHALQVNPFDQPAVQAYKNNTRTLW